MAAICIGGGLGGAMLIERDVIGRSRHHRDYRKPDATLDTRPATPTASRGSPSTGPARPPTRCRPRCSRNCNEALDVLDRAPPKGLVIRSGKANGFIAGADIEEFGDVKDDAERDRHRQARLGHVRTARGGRLPDAGAGARLLPGRRARAGARLPLSRRRRRAGNAAGAARSDARHRPGVGRHQAAAEAGRRARPRSTCMLTGKTIDARRAKKLGIADECVPARIMENTARGVLRALPPPRALPFPLSLTLNPLARRFIAAQARKQVAQRARREHYPAPYAILDLWVKYDGNALAAPASDPASIPSLLQTPTAANLIRVFRLQERLKALGKDGDVSRGARARRRRRHDGRRHRRVVRAARPDGDAAGPERRAARARRWARAAKLFAQRLKDPRRVARRDRPADSRRRRRRRRARRRHHRGDLREPRREAQRCSRRWRRRRSPAAILATNTSSIPLEDIAHGDGRPGAPRRPAFLQSGGADDAGRDRRRRGTRARDSCRRRPRSCARSTSCRCR